MSRPYHDAEARNRFEALIARLSSQPKKLDFDINGWLDEIKPLLQRSKRLKYRAILWNALMEHPPIKGTNPKWDAGVQIFLSMALDGLTKESAKNTLYFFSRISSLTDQEPLDQLRHCLDFMSDHRLRRQVLRHALHTTFNTIIFQKNVNSKERDSIDEKSKRVFREMLELEAAHDLTMPWISWWLTLRNTIGMADDTELLSTINAVGTGTLTRADRIDKPAIQLLFPLTKNTGARTDYYVSFTNWAMDTLLAIGLDWKTTPGITSEMQTWVETRPLARRDALLLIAENPRIDFHDQTPPKKPKL